MVGKRIQSLSEDNNTASPYLQSGSLEKYTTVKKSSTVVLPPFSICAINTSFCLTVNLKRVSSECLTSTLRISNSSSDVACVLPNGASEYSLCLSLKSESILIASNPVTDIWDNNVTIQFELDFRTQNTDSFECEVLVGYDWDHLETVNVPDVLEDIFVSLKRAKNGRRSSSFQSNKKIDKHCSSSNSTSMDIDECCENCPPEEGGCRPTARSIEKPILRSSRSYSESSDDGSLSTTPNRSILKKRLSNRSLSESSADDFAFHNSSLDVSCYVITESFKEEEMFGSMDRSKKTVRFSEVVKEQVFRTNSSILGQRKKNQRKNQYKKRKLSLSSSMESIDGENFDETMESGADRQTDDRKAAEENGNDSSNENNHCDSGIEFDGHEACSDGKKLSKKSKKKKSKAKKQKGDVVDLMFAMEI